MSFAQHRHALRVAWLRRHALSFLGALLLLAAGLKLYGAAFDPVRPSGLMALPAVQFGVVIVEIVLGLWFLSGLQRPLAWLTALVVFTMFAGVSFWSGWQGQTSCGCFGAIRVNPWHAFVLDVGIVAALLLGRPDLSNFLANPPAHLASALRVAALGGLGIAFFLGLTFALVHTLFDSPAAAIAYFRGERLSVSPRLVDLGAGGSGAELEARIQVSNWTNQAVRLIGGTRDCSCTVLEDLPVTIPARETRAVVVRVRLGGKPGVFNRRGALLVDDQGLNRLEFQMTGRITVGETVSATRDTPGN